MQDSLRKGRHKIGYKSARFNKATYFSGERSTNAVLTEADVVAARQAYNSGALLEHLAARFGITKMAMRKALVGETWKNASYPPCDNHSRLHGERNWQAKLTDMRVLDARRRVANGQQVTQIAREYGVDPETLRCAVIGKTWKHVGLTDDPRQVITNATLTEEDVVAVRIAFWNGDESIRSIAQRFGVSVSTISSVVKGRTWKHIELPEKAKQKLADQQK